MFPVTHSILSQHALASEILPLYFRESTPSCRLLVRGMNDTYLIRSGGSEYILRAYRHNHRSLSDILHELDLLQYLHGQGVGVSTPLARYDSQFLSEVLAPEGNRYLAVFTYAPGTFRPLTSEIARSYGQAAARLHRAMKFFESNYHRHHINLKYLLEDRVPWILPLLNHRPKDQLFVSQIGHFLQQQIDKMSPSLNWGLCHGDLNGGNCHIDNDGRVTFFDFDCEGPGWPAYDVAVFNWSVRDMPDRSVALKLWQEYLDAYQSEMPLSAADTTAIPYFVAARQIWLVGLHCEHADEWTYGNLNDAYFDRRLRILQELVKEQKWDIMGW
ncbi:phosphotransferase enzyme family protein [Paenibacillus eucommiae]|nr:phosphotransferase [Paenibacillus eucommiae]